MPTALEFYVYVYRNPLKGNLPFYVGKGHGYRATSHLTETRSFNPHKTNTIKKIQAAGLEPVIWIVWRGHNEGTAFQIEEHLIAKWGRHTEGGLLTNLTSGGEGASGYKHTEAFKRMISMRLTGRVVSEETRVNMSKAQKGHSCSDEHKRKLSDVQKGKIISIETRRKMSKAQKGRTASQETRRKMSDSQKGKNLSEAHMLKLRGCHSHISDETRRKLRDSHLGIRHSAERTRKIVEANTGRKHSEESKRKMSASQKARYNKVA